MISFVNLWKDISVLGVVPNMPYHLQKRIVLSNRMAKKISLIALVAIGVFAFVEQYFCSYVTVGFSLLVLLTPVLNRYGKTTLARFAFCLLQPLFIVLSSIFVKLHEHTGSDIFNYYFPRFLLMIWVIFPLILFDIRRKYAIATCIAAVFLLLLTYDTLHQLFDVIPASISVDTVSHRLVHATQLISMALFAAGFTLLQKINQKYERRIEKLLEDVHKANEEMEESSTFLEEAMEELMASNNEVYLQKEQIEVQNDFLTTFNQELVDAKQEIEEKNQQLQTNNGKLEQEVEERTLRLMITNRQLLSASRELDTFIYRASHDLMGPIVTLKGLGNLVLLDKANTAFYVDRFRNNIDVMHYRLSQLLQMLSIKDAEANIKKIDLHKIIQEVFSILNPAEVYPNIRIIQHIPQDMTLVSDEGMLQLVIEHIVRNALQYSKRTSGTPWVSIEVVSDEFTTCIHIRDNGIGISQENGPHIFDMFYRGTEQSKGAGLGLYVAKKAVEKLSGDIAWESNEEQTTFSILLAQKAEIVGHFQQETIEEPADNATL